MRRGDAPEAQGARLRGKHVRGWLVVAILALSLLPLLSTLPPSRAPYTPHARILINGDADFTPANGVTGGSGTPSDPFVIEGWDVNVSSGSGIRVANTRAAFSIRNVSVRGSLYGIHLVNVTNARVENSMANGTSWWGLYAENAPGVVVLNNTVTSSYNGIGVSGSPGSLVRGSVINQTLQVGIQLLSTSDIVVEANNISASWIGIDVESTDRAGIYGNSLWRSTDGVVLHESTYATMRNNTFAGGGVRLQGSELDHFRSHDIDLTNTVSGKPIRYVRDRDGATIDGLPTGQLIVANCTAPTVANVTVSGTDVGLGLYFVERANVTGNTITNNSAAGLILFHAGNSTVVGNNLSGNSAGGLTYPRNVIVDSSWNVLLERNNASSSPGIGIRVQRTMGANLVRNVVVCKGCPRSGLIGDGAGISVSDSPHVRVVGNLVQANETGIRVEYSPNGTFVLNEVRDSGWGISSYMSGGMRTYHNALVNNTLQAGQSYPNVPPNVWNDTYPSGGNYWSDYSGVDAGGDGIGDTPYSFNTNGVDHYPLMQPYVPSNEPPFAAFGVAPITGVAGTTFTMDASTSWDLEDLTPALQVRWDFQDDGTWDTPWSTAKVVQQTYSMAGLYWVRLEVQDSSGLTNEATLPVVVYLPPHVALPSPGGLVLSRPNADDIRLDWRAVRDATGYCVYESGDRFAPFPSMWTLLGTTSTPSLTAAGHASDRLPHFYLVRAVNGTEEGPNSTMGAKTEQSFTFDPARTNIAWFSLPYNSTYRKASDIASALGTSKIDLVGKWDPANQTSLVYYYARGRWRGTDFALGPGDGLYVGVLQDFVWSLMGTDLEIPLRFTRNALPRGNVNWFGLPYSGVYARASDIARELGPSRVVEIGLWNMSRQAADRWFWDGLRWTGSDFDIDPGAGVYLVIASDFTWTPSLLTPVIP